MPQLYLKKALAQVFSCEFCEIFKNTYFAEHLFDVGIHSKFLEGRGADLKVTANRTEFKTMPNRDQTE